MNTKRNKSKKWLFVALGVVIAIPLFIVLWTKYEGQEPYLDIDLSSGLVGKSRTFYVNVSDSGCGVRRVWAGLMKDGREVVLLDKSYAENEEGDGNKVKRDSLSFEIAPEKLGLTDGKAMLRIAAWDNSWRKLFKGNRVYIEKEVMIDTRPPALSVLSRRHNVSQGGTGLVIYKVSESGTDSGVFVDGKKFPGYPGYFSDKNIYLAFFALNHLQGPDTQIYVGATDAAGNRSKSGLSYYISPKRFKKDQINLSDRFLNWKLPAFDMPQEHSLIDQFLTVNGNIRVENGKKITSPGTNTEKIIYWEGSFSRLPRSATRATYADYRSYHYKGGVVDHQYHLGIDLASVKHAPIPAANEGKVVLVDKIGIYGNTVVIDHGFGLFSFYSHMSSVSVEPGQIISRDEIIGRTGITGMTGGDHLHYGMFVHDVFVNPREWWDASWIENNIMAKLEAVEAGL